VGGGGGGGWGENIASNGLHNSALPVRCISIFGVLVKIFRFLGYAETSNPDVPLILGGTDSCSLSFSCLRVPCYSLAFLSVNIFN